MTVLGGGVRSIECSLVERYIEYRWWIVLCTDIVHFECVLHVCCNDLALFLQTLWSVSLVLAICTVDVVIKPQLVRYRFLSAQYWRKNNMLWIISNESVLLSVPLLQHDTRQTKSQASFCLSVCLSSPLRSQFLLFDFDEILHRRLGHEK